MSEPLLTLSGVTLRHGAVTAIDRIDLDVAAGAAVALIGANGAGKTTLLRGVSGLLAPATGSIRFAGQDIAGEKPHRIARLGIVQVPEGRQLFAGLSVAENLRMGAYLVRDPSEIARRHARVLDLFPRLGERLAQSAGLLSGGEQQMLAIGRALMAEPRLLLLDEPSMGLAPLFVDEIFAIIARLKQAGATILLVEQNARAALEICDHAYVLETGRVTLDGPAATIADDPRVIAAYLGGG
jgi:branched-chain amino acid transport system ATP-binding protein